MKLSWNGVRRERETAVRRTPGITTRKSPRGDQIVGDRARRIKVVQGDQGDDISAKPRAAIGRWPSSTSQKNVGTH